MNALSSSAMDWVLELTERTLGLDGRFGLVGRLLVLNVELCLGEIDLGLRKNSIRLGVFSLRVSSHPDLRSIVRGRGWDLVDDGECVTISDTGEGGGLLKRTLLYKKR
jgi:hypothetical protein